MRVTKIFSTLLFLFLSVLSFAQKGWIRGTVYDGKTGEFLPGVTIVADGTTTGTITDLDGAFNLNIGPGTYTIRISFISYAPLVMSDVVVKSGQATVLENLTLKETTIEIGEAVVTARAIRNTEMAVLAMKKNSVNVLDAISAAGLKRTGDSDAASSLKRVTGVSVEGGKYVFVRGLGDRYTKTVLNGLDIPGLDPDRNTLQMDIFPSSIIENMVVNKTFSADLPADFTGGVIDIHIKDFPETKTGSVSASLGYNPDAHFNKDYLTYDGGRTDFLGFDDGTRDIPATTNIPFFQDAYLNQQGEAGQRYQEILRSFNPTMAATKERSLMDFGLGASFGNQFEKGKYTLGYTFSFSYKNNTEFYENAENGSYGKKADQDETEMEVRNFQTGSFGVNDVMLSGLAGFAVKTRNAKYSLYLMHLQNGQSQAGIFDYKTTNLGTEFSGFQHNLEYNQRALTNLMLDGKYNLPGKNWEIEWKISPTFSSIKDPDIRFTRYQVRENGVHAIGTEVGFPLRIWRDLEEKNLAGVVHLTKKFRINNQDAKLRFGGAYTYKQRDFIIRNFTINPRGNVPLTGNPDELFWPENLWPYQGNIERGITYETPFIPNNANQFDAEVRNLAAYLSGELSLFKGMKAVAGLRVENYIQHYSGKNQSATIVFDKEKVLDTFDLFPTINLIYRIAEDQNLRLAWSKTIARPSFKELSFAQIFDPITGRSFIGGLSRDEDTNEEVVYWDGNLVSTDIQNFDFRWELFQPAGQTVSLGAFYKTFKNPIEMVQFVSNKGSFQPRNVGDGQVIGGEIELRQNMKTLGESLKNLTLMVNYTYIRSKIEMSDSEYDSRLKNARTGETINDTRDMAGQAPYLINAGLTYDVNGGKGFAKGLDAGLFYNVQGKTLQYVGINDLPDVYSKPFHSLNFNMTKVLGEKERFQLGFKVENLLDAKRESVYQSYHATDQYFERRSPGTKFEFKLSYSLY